RACRAASAISGRSLFLPLEVGDAVGLLGHQAGQPALGQLGLELLPDPGLLLGVGDLAPGTVLHLLGVAGELPQRMESQVARRSAAHVEVLVEPAVGRHDDAALVPRRHDLLLTLLPEDGKAFAGGNDDYAARP